MPASTSLGSPWELSAGGRTLPPGCDRPREHTAAAGETHLLQVTLLENNTELYTAQNTKIKLDTTRFWRLAKYRK